MKAPIPPDEAKRLEELVAYDILDSAPEPAFDGLVELVTKILDVPIALITFVDSDRQWFKSAAGLDVRETPREHGMCQRV